MTQMKDYLESIDNNCDKTVNRLDLLLLDTTEIAAAVTELAAVTTAIGAGVADLVVACDATAVSTAATAVSTATIAGLSSNLVNIRTNTSDTKDQLIFLNTAATGTNTRLDVANTRLNQIDMKIATTNDTLSDIRISNGGILSVGQNTYNELVIVKNISSQTRDACVDIRGFSQNIQTNTVAIAANTFAVSNIIVPVTFPSGTFNTLRVFTPS